MQEQQLFEYAVIRVVPRVEREEFINVGVIVFCKKKGFLKTAYTINEARLKALYPALDVAEVKSYLHAVAQISRGDKAFAPIGKLDAPSRFRWLTATRSTIVQTSKVHPGFCSDLETAVHKLFEQYVL